MSESIAGGMAEVPATVPGAAGSEVASKPAPPAPGRSNAPALRFAATAIGLGLLLFALFRVPTIQKRVLIPYAEAQQSVAAAVLGQKNLPVVVSFACTGADVIALCVGSVLAFPVAWRKRLLGAAVGLGLITVVNTVRIGSLSSAVGDEELFQTLHVVVWPAVLIVLVSLYVFSWMRWATPRSAEVAARGRGSSPALRFALWLVPLTVVYLATSSWYLNAPWVLAATRWTAATAAALMSLVGVASKVTGNTLTTVHGGFVVTPTCIATPLVPVFFASALALPTGWLRRAAWLAIGPVVFFALGVLRLLVLALPASIVPSYSDAIHAFNSLLFAVILVALAAIWNGRTTGEQPGEIARRTVTALALGAGVALLVAASWSRALRALSSGLLGLVGHDAHTMANTQGAAGLLPAFQLGLFAALAWALAVGASRRWGTRRALALGGLLAASQLALYVALTELWTHRAFEPDVRALRAWAVLAPAALAWWLVRRGRTSPAPAHSATEPLAERV